MKYKTKDGQDYTVPGIGRTVNGMIVTDRVIENSNFELVEETAPAAPIPPTPTPPVAPAPVPQPAPAPPAPQTNQGSVN